jgi:hypothetical protein
MNWRDPTESFFQIERRNVRLRNQFDHGDKSRPPRCDSTRKRRFAERREAIGRAQETTLVTFCLACHQP